MAVWIILQPLLIIHIALFLISQVLIPVFYSRSVFPIFRKRAENMEMSAKRALELVEHHCFEALKHIEIAESFAENEKKEAQNLLKEAQETLISVKERAEVLKVLEDSACHMNTCDNDKPEIVES